MSDFEDVKPYTQAELDQQAIWANEFDQWWENEGQYQRAGGGQYERSFAWWAWLNQEQKQQAKIDELHKISVALNTETIRQREQVAYYLSKNAELQKRVDAAKQLIEDLNKCYQQNHQNKFEYWRGFADSAGILRKRLEQALKGGNE